MSDVKTRKIIGDLRGGRNGADPPLALADNQVVDAVNVDWYRTTFANKRNGLSAAGVTFSSGGPFTGKVSALCRHVPGTDETAAEVWAIDDAATPVVGRKASTSAFLAPTLKDNLTGNAWETSFATLNQKLFLAYKSGSGFSAPAAPTRADVGSGTYAATARYYRVRWIQQVASVTTRRSPVGTAAASFTPSGTGSAVRVTRPTAPNTGETHWELEVSYDNVVFRVLYGDGGIFAAIAIATTTGDDSSTTASGTIIDTFTSSGTWTRPAWVTSASYLIVAGGGAGGASTGNANGGGGGGGVLTGTDSGLASSTYAVTVGTGGQTAQANGGNSSWNSHTATGGGGGGGGASGLNGIAGGSGGGGGGQDNATGTGGSGTGGQGNAGGSGGTARGCHPCDPSGSGGGGGAGSGGSNGGFTGGSSGTSIGGNGGNGTASSISGSSVTYGAGGGGGGGNGGAPGTGGTGGGGNGGNGGAGSDGTGVGAGGGGSFNSNTPGKGTTGTVIVSYSALSITNAGLSNADALDRLHVWDGQTVRRTGLQIPTGLGTIDQQNTTNSTTEFFRDVVGDSRTGQSFQVSVSAPIAVIELQLFKTGTPTGNMWIQIEADSAGSPSGTSLATSATVDVSTLPTSTAWRPFVFSTPYTPAANTSVWFVIYGDFTISAANFTKYQISNTNAYANGLYKRFDGATWTTPASVDADFKMTLDESGSGGLAGIFDTGTGTYAATLRYYRIRWTQQSAGLTIRRSEAGSATSYTPAGTGLSLTIVMATPPGEGETHWELEGSTDNVTFYVLYGDNGKSGAATAITTRSVTDTVAPASYSTGSNVSPLTGTYTLQHSYKYIAADQNRLLGFGNYLSTNKQNRVEISAVIGSLNVGDEERVDTTAGYYVDLDESDSGNATGLIGPALGGSYFPFKDKQTWQLTPTGQSTAPYRRTALSKVVGAVAGAQCVGEDAYGNAAIYWLSHRGPYRYSASRGLEYIGHGIEDVILGPTSTINLTATNVIGRVAYHLEKRQVWVGVATGASNDPNNLLIFDVVQAERTRDLTGQITGGWSRVPTTDVLANLRALAMLPTTIGATMSRDLKPYIGSATTANKIYKCDDPAATDDAGTAFQAYVVTRPIEPGGADFNGTVGESRLLAKTSSGVTITASLTANFDPARVQTGTCTLTADGTETRVSKTLEGSAFSEDVGTVAYQIGDASAVSNAWTLDRLTIPFKRQEAQSR